MKGRRLLTYAFAISIVLHLTALPFIRSARAPSAEESIPIVDVAVRPTPPPVVRPTPRPTPASAATRPPRLVPHAIHPRRLRIVVPHASARGGAAGQDVNRYAGTGGDAHGLPDAPPGPGAAAAAGDGPAPSTPAPPAATPLPTPTPRACARPNVAAATLRAAEPETPAAAVAQNISGTVAVVVSLDASGRVVDAHVQSSPSAVLNAAALAAARGSVFRAETRDCVPIAAEYLFTVEFAAQ